MSILVTGAAGFIGYHVAEALLGRDEIVIGIDDLNPYYDVRLKEARLDRLRTKRNFVFHQSDIADRHAIMLISERHPDITEIVHLAAQAGVRYSLVDPWSYVRSNVMGHLVMLEAARKLPRLRHFVYASSSSVYGANQQLPFREIRQGGCTCVSLCRHETRGRTDEPRLRSPVRSPTDRIAIFHRLRPLGAAGHGVFQLRPRDRLG
jgi:nucleoside-diphosphate-sugar epimerase